MAYFSSRAHYIPPTALPSGRCSVIHDAIPSEARNAFAPFYYCPYKRYRPPRRHRPSQCTETPVEKEKRKENTLVCRWCCWRR